jgi:hypothetical protein
MAKTSKLARNAQRKELVARHAPKRAALKAIINSPKSTQEEKLTAVNALHAMPRDSSATRGAQPLQHERPSARVPAALRFEPHCTPGYGPERPDPRRAQGELVTFLIHFLQVRATVCGYHRRTPRA